MEVGSDDLSSSRFFRFIHIGQSVLEENTVIIMEKEASCGFINNILVLYIIILPNVVNNADFVDSMFEGAAICHTYLAWCRVFS